MKVDRAAEVLGRFVAATLNVLAIDEYGHFGAGVGVAVVTGITL